VTGLPPGDLIADGDLFGGLPPGEREAVMRRIGTAAHEAGTVFYVPEDPAERVFVLVRGRVRLYKLSPEGRALTLMVLEAPAVFGDIALADPVRHDSFAEAMTDCEVGELDRKELRELLGANPALALRLMAIMSRRLRAMERKLADIAFKSVPQRLATVLLGLVGEPDAGPSSVAPAVLRYTHQQLAEMIGSYRETVTKALGEFREAGLIRVEEDAVHLTDIGRLRQIVGG
jgi:CRP-like cAMP-binding protein